MAYLSTVDRDKAYANAHILHVRQILAAFFGGVPIEMLRISTRQEDTHEAADLVLELGAIKDRIGVRVRHPSMLVPYFSREFDITVRASRPYVNDRMVERDKIRRGYGEYMLYGYGDDKSYTNPSGRIRHAFIVDLRELRIRIDEDKGPWLRPQRQKTVDADFDAYDVRRLGPKCVIGMFGMDKFKWVEGSPWSDFPARVTLPK